MPTARNLIGEAGRIKVNNLGEIFVATGLHKDVQIGQFKLNREGTESQLQLNNFDWVTEQDVNNAISVLSTSNRPPLNPLFPWRNTNYIFSNGTVGPAIKNPETGEFVNALDFVSEDISEQQKATNAINEQRYNEALADLTGLQQRGNQVLSGIGGTERSDIQRQFGFLGTQQKQNLIGRGLTGTTIQPGVRSSNLANMFRELGAANERQSVRQLSFDTDISKSIAGLRERRIDKGPDITFTSQILKDVNATGV